MATHLPLRKAILMVLQTGSRWQLDELVSACPEFTWNQIFLALDEMSRSGEVCITRERHSGYTITVLFPEGYTHTGQDVLDSKSEEWKTTLKAHP